MRHITEEGLALIKHFEGFSYTPYICPAGWRTIGYGHVIKTGENFTSITKEEGEELLKKDILIAEISVLKNIEVPLEDYQFDALTSFTFNLGGGALQRSTLRMKVNRNEHTEAAIEFLKWVWAKGKRLRGLLIRRQAEAQLYMGGGFYG